MQRPFLVDRARDLFLNDKTMLPEKAVTILVEEYPEFTRDQCLEAVTLYFEVVAALNRKKVQ